MGMRESMQIENKWAIYKADGEMPEELIQLAKLRGLIKDGQD